VTLPSGQLVSRVGDGGVPGPEEDDCKGHVPLLTEESEKEISFYVLGNVDPVSQIAWPGRLLFRNHTLSHRSAYSGVR
jgi:hypothetical protein